MSRARKVEILGAGWTRGVVPPLDTSPGVERWGTNKVMFVRREAEYAGWTRWFDLHRTPHILKQRPEAYEWYTAQDGSRPIYRWEVDPAIPGSVAYPIDRVRAHFGAWERDFWGSLSWMLALAIVEGFDQIDLFWFPLSHDRATNMTDQIPVGQYSHQVPSTRYWIGQARGRGIDVTIHGDSELKPTHPLYGVETT